MNETARHHVLFLHGFTSSARSGKAKFLEKCCASLPDVELTLFDFNPTPRDFEYLTITGMINRLRQFLVERKWQPVTLTASSLGGLVATHYAQRFGGVRNILLLAPALFYHPWGTTEEQLACWKQLGTALIAHHGFQKEMPLRYSFHEDGLGYTKPVPPAAETTIIHGRQDKTVPVTCSREYAATYPNTVRLLEIDADHRLTNQHEFLWETTLSILRG